jgi:surfactin synthase thioesterase subunit
MNLSHEGNFRFPALNSPSKLLRFAIELEATDTSLTLAQLGRRITPARQKRGCSRIMQQMDQISPWFAQTRPIPQAKFNLFCFPYAGGGASIFRTWQDSLPGTIKVYPAHLPGRESRLRETPITRLPAIIEEISHAIHPHLDRPFGFFGHSMGALISFELTRYLRRTYSIEPHHLFVSGHRAPQLGNQLNKTSHLPEPEFLKVLRDLNGTLPGVLEHPELLHLMIPLLRADFAVCETYAYTDEAPLSCPITVFGGLQDDQITREHLGAWRDHTTGSFALNMFPGDHFFLRTTEQLLLGKLYRDLQRTLDRVSRESQ